MNKKPTCMSCGRNPAQVGELFCPICKPSVNAAGPKRPGVYLWNTGRRQTLIQIFEAEPTGSTLWWRYADESRCWRVDKTTWTGDLCPVVGENKSLSNYVDNLLEHGRRMKRLYDNLCEEYKTLREEAERLRNEEAEVQEKDLDPHATPVQQGQGQGA